MFDAGHIEELIATDCHMAVYHKAYQKAYSYKADKLNLQQQQQLKEYVDILRICSKFKGNIVAMHMNIKGYASHKQ